MQDIVIELPAPFVVFGGLILASILVAQLPLSRFTGRPAPLSQLQERMGLSGLDGGVFFVILLFWAVIFLSLFLGLLAVIWSFAWGPLPTEAEIWDWRFSLAKLTALTAVLGAVVALPFTLIRLKLAREQNAHAEEALYNDKMNTAVEDLYAQRQITKWNGRNNETASNGWEDDITRRNGAIDRLKGLVEENIALLPRVDRMLTVYLQELTREYPAEVPPADATPKELKAWAETLTRKRSDMENAVQTLSQLPRDAAYLKGRKPPDLQDINMQAFKLSGLTLNEANLRRGNLRRAKLQGADLIRAKLQGANLSWAQLQGADLIRAQLQGAQLFLAQLQGANLSWAQLQGADLSVAKLQGATLWEAQLQGADLRWARFDTGTSLTNATLRGAGVREVDFTDVPQIAAHLEGMFGDASVTLPEGVTAPGHWAPEKLDWEAFETEWRAFQHSIGQDPDNPE